MYSHEDDTEIARRLEPPKALPTPENCDPEEVSFFGETTLSGGLGDERKTFGLLREDRRKHLYLIGKSGVGKTKLLEHLIRSDIYYGHGVCVVDPNGDLIQNLLNFIPEDRVKDVVLIDFSNPNQVPAWNPLAQVPRGERHHIVSGIVEVFSRLFGSSWNPRAEHLLRFALLALLDHPKSSFATLLGMLSSSELQKEIVANSEPGVVKRFWEHEYETWQSAADKRAMSVLINTLSAFLSHPHLFSAFSSTENKINLQSCIQEGKIVLVCIPKGVLGDSNSTLIGSLFLALFKRAALTRAQTHQDQRFPFYLYVDEFQNVATESFLSLLSESNRYNICLTASNQFLGQMSTPLKNAVLGNAGTLVAFQVSAEDAEILSKEFAPVVESRDLINLPEREFYAKISVSGRRYDPFSGITLEVANQKWPSQKKRILEIAEQQYLRKI